jgi:hypothetical protein
MIAELLRLAELNELTGSEAFRNRPVHWFVDLDTTGRPLGLTPTVGTSDAGRTGLKTNRGKVLQTPRNYHMQVCDGSVRSVCTNQSNWLPDFLVAPVSEVFPGGVGGEQPLRFPKRKKTWQLLFQAFRALPEHPALRAVIGFLKSRPRFEDGVLSNVVDSRMKEGGVP